MDLKEKIANLLWDMVVDLTLKDGITQSKLAKAEQIHDLYKQAGYVQLEPDQSLPENPYYFDTNAPFAHMDYTDEDYAKLHTYSEAQHDMLKAGFKKVL